MVRYKRLLSIISTITFLSITEGSAFEVTSSDFKNNSPLPAVHTCDGKNRAPHFSWSGAPAGTKSFALTCIDPDAPSGDFVHWIVYDIPVSVSSLPPEGPLPKDSKVLSNDFGEKMYKGPCPPSGIHRYFFTVYALNVTGVGQVQRDTFMKKIEEHKIGSATIIGLYKRR